MKYSFFKKATAVVLTAFTVTAGSSVTANAAVFTFGSTTTSSNLTIPLNSQPIVLEKNKTYTLPQIHSRLFSGVTYDITTDNSRVVSAKNGVITANGVGTATITVKTSGGLNITKKVTVKAPEVTVKLDKSSLTLGKGESTALKAILSASGIQAVNWSSSDSRVVSVDSKGKITAQNNGTATVTATLANGKKSSCVLTVKAAPNKITLSKNKLEIGLGESYDIGFTIPGNTASYSVKYTSSNPSVITVDSNTGKITSKKTGTAVITAKTYNGKTASCTIEVKQPPKTITLKQRTVTVKKGEKVKLIAELPNGSASGKITYMVSNDKIASVTSDGTVTGKNKGTTYVAVKTYNGKAVTCKVTVS